MDPLITASAEQVGPDAGSPWSYAVSALYLAVYSWRWFQCRRDASIRSPGIGRLVAFTTACALLGGALGPPLDSWAEESATMHMVQHVILLDLVPILMFAGLTKAMLRPATRRLHRLDEKAGVLALPAFAAALYVGLMYAWHVPGLYDAALRSQIVHFIEHATLLTAGFAYWWHLMSPVRARHRLAGTGPAIYMATTKVLVAILGVVLIFSPGSLYAYTGTFLGMDPLTDQHVAGVVMSTEQTIVMGIAFAILFLRMLSDSERRQLQAERGPERSR